MIQAIIPPSFNALGFLSQILLTGWKHPPVLQRDKKPSAYSTGDNPKFRYFGLVLDLDFGCLYCDKAEVGVFAHFDLLF